MHLPLALALLAAQANATPPQTDLDFEPIRSNVVCRAGTSSSGGVEHHEGTIKGSGSCEYRVTLRRSQSLTADLDAAPGVTAYIASPDHHDLVDGRRFTAPAAGTYVVRVAQSRLLQRASDPATPFKLRLTID